MPDSSSDRNPVEALAEEFLARHRRGEKPTVAEYAELFPQHAAEIRDLFPALLMMEDVRPDSQDATGAHVAPSVAPGQRLERLGEYRILREIGRGGMGIVYEAEQVSLGRHVALKVLPSHALLDARQLARFQREARAAAQLHHTNIVPVHGVGEQDGLHYYVMQFIQGLGLDQVLAELKRLRQTRPTLTPREPPPGLSAIALAQTMLTGQPPWVNESEVPPAPQQPQANWPIRLPGQSDPSTLSDSGRAYWESVARIGIQVAEALAYANGQGILHRDIKPSNLLLDTQGTVWVTDLGLAKGTSDAGPLTRTGDFVGTVCYGAPERFNGAGDGRSDLYSLGLVLYELLTLRRAFDADDLATQAIQAMRADPPAPRSMDPRIPRDLETIVLKAIARDPDARYQTGTELADDLKHFLEDRPIRARRISELERLWRWCRRNPATAGLMTAVAASLLLGIIVSSWFAIQAQRRGDELKKALAENQRRLVQSYVDSGLQAVQGGEMIAALPWFAAALRLDRDDPQRAENHRTRISSVLWHCPRLLRLWEHGEAVHHVRFSPDGRHALSAGDDGLVRIWDVTTGKERRPPLEHAAPVTWAGFNPDGTRLFTVSSDHVVRIWDAADSRPITPPLSHPDRIWHVDFSPDGRRLVTACADGGARVWDLTKDSNDPLCLELVDNLRYAAFSPDGRRLMTVAAGNAGKEWDARTGQSLVRASGGLLGGVLSEKLFDAGTRSHWSWLGHALDLRPMQSSSSSSRTPGLRRPWEGTGYGERMPDERAMEDRTPAVQLGLSPDAARVVAAGPGRSALVWDLETREPAGPALPHQDVVRHAAFAPDGLRLLTGCQDGSVRLWDTGCRRLFEFSKAAAEEVDLGARAGWVSPDEKWLVRAGADHTAKLFRKADRKEVAVLRHDDTVHFARFSGDGRMLLTASRDRRARVWDVETGKQLTPPLRHAGQVCCASFSLDLRRVLTATEDWTTRLWDVRTGEVLGIVVPHEAKPASHQEPDTSPPGPPTPADMESEPEVVDLQALARIEAAGLPRPARSTARSCTPRSVVELSQNGRRFLALRLTDHWHTPAWELLAEGATDEEYFRHAEVLSGQRVDERGGLVFLDRAAIRRSLDDLSALAAEQLAASSESRLGWHREQAVEANPWKAAWHLSRFLEARSDDVPMLHQRAARFAEIPLLRPRAVADLTRVIELQKEDGQAWAARGLVQLQLSMPGPALSDLDRATQLLPGRKSLRLVCSIACSLLGQDQRADRAYAEAGPWTGREVIEGAAKWRQGGHGQPESLDDYIQALLPEDGVAPWRQVSEYLDGLAESERGHWYPRCRALASLCLHDWTTAARSYDRAQATAPRDQELLRGRAVAFAGAAVSPRSDLTAYSAVSALEMMRTACEAALAAHPSDGLVLYLRGLRPQAER